MSMDTSVHTDLNGVVEDLKGAIVDLKERETTVMKTASEGLWFYPATWEKTVFAAGVMFVILLWRR